MTVSYKCQINRYAKICLLSSWLLTWSTKAVAEDPLRYLDPATFGPGTILRALEKLEIYRPPQAVQPVLALLTHPDLEVSKTAAWLLRRMGQAYAGVQAAGTVLENTEGNLESRIAAAMSLGELKHPSALSLLAQALASDPEALVRAQVAEALGELARPDAYQALALSIQQEQSVVVRSRVARALGNIPTDQIGALEQAIEDSSPVVRLEAIWSIGRRKLKNLVLALIARLQDSDCRVGAASAWALSQLGEQQACSALSEAVYGSCRLTSQAALWALTDLGTLCIQ